MASFVRIQEILTQIAEWDREAERQGRKNSEEARDNLRDAHNMLVWAAGELIDAGCDIKAYVRVGRYHPLGEGKF